MSSSSEVVFTDWSEYDEATQTLKDFRDGRVYRTVTIGKQVWMAENMDLETERSYCYKNSPENCTKYGRLYRWSAVMDSAGLWNTSAAGCGFYSPCTPTYPVRGVCPVGWHVPTYDEFDTLRYSMEGGVNESGTRLKSKTGWKNGGNGDDLYGFTALPSGEGGSGLYWFEGESAEFWTSEVSDDGCCSVGFKVDYYYPDARMGSRFTDANLAVRCLKD